MTLYAVSQNIILI